MLTIKRLPCSLQLYTKWVVLRGIDNLLSVYLRLQPWTKYFEKNHTKFPYPLPPFPLFNVAGEALLVYQSDLGLMQHWLRGKRGKGKIFLGQLNIFLLFLSMVVLSVTPTNHFWKLFKFASRPYQYLPKN